MKTLNRSNVALLGLSLAVALAACADRTRPEAASTTPSQVYGGTTPSSSCYNDCGTITRVEEMKDEGTGSGLGMVLGAVAGAVVGHQVGGGRGQDAATVIGAVGGGVAGNEIEKRVKGTAYFHVTVIMDNGRGTQTADVASMNGLVTGSRVKVIGNNLQPLS